MKEIEVYRYDQNNSGGSFRKIENFDDNVGIYPSFQAKGWGDLTSYLKKHGVERPVVGQSYIGEQGMREIIYQRAYTDICVIDKNVIPPQVYFDGVDKGIDCSCCGDRWSELYSDEKEKLYIFENDKDFYDNYEKLPQWANCLILEDVKDLKGVKEIKQNKKYESE